MERERERKIQRNTFLEYFDPQKKRAGKQAVAAGRNLRNGLGVMQATAAASCQDENARPSGFARRQERGIELTMLGL